MATSLPNIQIIQGIPYWISEDNKVYLFNNSLQADISLHIGYYNSAQKNVQLSGDWKQIGSPALNTYRSTIQPIPRSDYANIQKFSKKPRSTRQNAGKKAASGAGTQNKVNA